MGEACFPLEPSVVAFPPPAPVQVAQAICSRDPQKEWDAMMLRRLEGGAAASLDVVQCLRHNARAWQPAGARVSMRRTSLTMVLKVRLVI